MLESITKDINFRRFKLVVPFFGVAYMLHQIMAPQFYTDWVSKNSVESFCKW